MDTYMMGVDLGTTSTKAVLFDQKGKVKSQSTVEYPLNVPEPGAAVQDPTEILEAVKRSIREVMDRSGISKKSLKLISFSAAMHSLIAIDDEGLPLTPSITWADQRSEPYAEEIKSQTGLELYKKTGTPIHPMSPLTNILWIRKDQPEIFKRTAKFIGIKEYIFNVFFKEYVVDHSIASATGLLNMYTLDWDEEALEIAGISSDYLSRLVSTTTQFKGLNSELANEMGIDPEVPFIIGANDGCLANLGVDAVMPGEVAITIGTSGAIRTVTDKPITDEKGRTFCYALTENHWVIGGPVNNGGMVLRWLRDEFCAEEVQQAKALNQNPYDLITDRIDQVAAGSEGLLFHPYLSGERAPSWNANARGSFFGLAMHHKRDHMMRAVLEGINMNMYMVLLALEELIGTPKEVRATGGFAHSKVWRQMVADIFGHEVHVPETVESACLGAAILGLFAIGEIDDLSEVKRMVKTRSINHPNKEKGLVYKELLPIFIRLSRLYEQEYQSVVAFQNKYTKIE
ncbi:gluconokinase [Marinilactibacillus sp. XAAS-LB27]|uniref:gluconokinase n=1 Tax=Marinilactibacillus sp. XAAS-LB27 TaxID=3114538 RepID=UPI002E1725DC|nr:gluconokinase [Marinilactibacillus sp. XAAS-LB27]